MGPLHKAQRKTSTWSLSNLIFTCVIEESIFRHFIQKGLQNSFHKIKYGDYSICFIWSSTLCRRNLIHFLSHNCRVVLRNRLSYNRKIRSQHCQSLCIKCNAFYIFQISRFGHCYILEYNPARAFQKQCRESLVSGKNKKGSP